MRRDSNEYIDQDAVKEELLWARRLCNRRGWPVIDVTRRSIEETAATVLQLMEAWHNRQKHGATPAPVLVTLVLASGSAIRRTLLEAAGLAFTVRPVAVDEAAMKAALAGEEPGDVALALADLKARRVRQPGALVIGADQLLVCDGEWFDKPPDLAAARAQLVALRGRSHELVTAVTCWRDGTMLWRHVARPRLTMRAFSDAFLDWYLARGGRGGAGLCRRIPAGGTGRAVVRRGRGGVRGGAGIAAAAAAGVLAAEWRVAAVAWGAAPYPARGQSSS